MTGRSRYQAIPQASFTSGDGERVPYLLRRLPPIPQDDPAGPRVAVRSDERLDLVAARLLGDPLQFWRLCDANCALDPFDLVKERAHGIVIPSPFDVLKES